jgi:ATP-binding cassette, subfamily B, bacterial
MTIGDLHWPISRLGEGIEELARRARLRPAPGEPITVPDAVMAGDTVELDHWIEWVGTRLGIDVEPIESMAPSIERLLTGAGPAVLRVKTDEGPRFLLLLRFRFGSAQMIATDLTISACPLEQLRTMICAEHEAPLMESIDRLLNVAKITTRRRRSVRDAIVRERLATHRIGGFWMLRLPPTSQFSRQLVRENAPLRLVAMLALFASVYVLEILGWTVIGDAALNGRVDFGWLTAWVLLVLSTIPLRLVGNWIDSTFAIDVGGLLKLRLLLGALRLDIEVVKSQGVGQLLGRVMESQALEALVVNGGLAALVAVMELGFAAWILSIGSGGQLHLALLAIWLAITVALGWRYYRRLFDWTLMRLDMTHDLIEQMVGHRTRLAQEWSARRNAFEDRSIKDYLTTSAGMDRAILPFLSGVPTGWMIVGLLGLVPAFVAGSGTPVGFAIGLGGVLAANRALSGIAEGLSAAARAAIAWRQAAPLFRAGAESVSATPYVPRKRKTTDATPRLIDADSLTFRYLPDGDPVLNKASLSISHGDRILLEGASGGGKSTLASLLVGLRQPDSGLLLLNGLDRHTLGAAWHQVATEAPQFHENHIFTATMGFNLLMGRNWPATDEELAEAENLCIELGLGDLLQRMPSGMMQTVGETGWQLSHGERSRIFLARALLQNAQLTILDESFAALDPETLKICLDCAFRRAQTLVVIAHP